MHEPNIIESFKKAWNSPPRIIASAPARANLIGDHVDYNGGVVLPFALPFRLTIAASGETEDWSENIMEFVSDEFGWVTMGTAIKKKEHTFDWLQIPAGISQIARNLGLKVGGRYYIESEIPIGSGLSSSAAFENALLSAIFALNGRELDLKEIALLGQRVENEFLKVKSGIMDQMASALGKKGHLLLIDCANVDYKYIRWHKTENSLWIIHSGVSRMLVKSEYNERRADCEKALEIINADSSVKYKYLAYVPIDVVKKLKEKLGTMLYKRAKHVVSEAKRVHDVVGALQKGDISAVGRALFESHKSLKNDYQVSCKELDLLVELAKTSGALGARLVGAGFGGAAIFLVPNDRENEFLKIKNVYKEKTKKGPMIWKVWPSDGLSVEFLK